MKDVEGFFFFMAAFTKRRCLFICNGTAYILCLDGRSAGARNQRVVQKFNRNDIDKIISKYCPN